MITDEIVLKVKAALFGLAVGDALGVPVEFKSRAELRINPVKDMRGYGTWQQPAGTWSDDSSLAFCLAESLASVGYNPDDIAAKFISWRNEGYWAAHHRVFDIGNATNAAITRLIRGVKPILAGGFEEGDNGNGSLMRILPLVVYVKSLPIAERFEVVKSVSSITHAHFRSVLACYIYIEMAILLWYGFSARVSYNKMQEQVNQFIALSSFNREEVKLFDRVLQKDISGLQEQQIHSGGYVIHTLEAALWSLLTTETYAGAVLRAVNLGEDTDTTACVVGGLAGLLYGYNGLLEEWSREIARFDDIDNLCETLTKRYL